MAQGKAVSRLIRDKEHDEISSPRYMLLVLLPRELVDMLADAL